MASSSMSKRQKSGALEKDIRLPIVEEILKYLPIKKIVKCKLICKAWMDLISNPLFTERQFAAAQSSILLRSLKESVPQTLYLIEPSKISSNICYCNVHDGGNRGKETVDTKLRFPMVYKSTEAEDSDDLWEDGLAPVNDMVQMKKFYTMNSCNGFLCLNGSWKERRIIICNPFTNEYVNLPNMSFRKSASRGNYFGFGFCPLTKKYKVLRIVHNKVPMKVQCPVLGISFDTSWVTKILTVGTGSWRTIGNVPSFFRQMDSCTYVNGMLYWCNGEGSEHRIGSFDFENEIFELVPKLPRELGSSVNMILGTINGRLCLLDVSYSHVWVLEDVDGTKTWSKLSSFLRQIGSDKWPHSVVKLASCSECERYYFFQGNADGGEVIYYDHKTREWKKREVIGGKQPHFQAVVHTPTLVSLKHAMPGVEVVSPLQESRGAYSEPLYLMEEQRQYQI